jgi:hypothetical protein
LVSVKAVSKPFFSWRRWRSSKWINSTPNYNSPEDYDSVERITRKLDRSINAVVLFSFALGGFNDNRGLRFSTAGGQVPSWSRSEQMPKVRTRSSSLLSDC